jgi:hypothetical protein
MPAMSEDPQSSLILYQTEDGQTKVEVRLVNETVWLSQKLMAELFQKDIRTINEHIRNVFAEGELQPDATIRKFRIVQHEGNREVQRQVEYYNLDVIISVGYRVKSHRGTQFRIWATKRLREFIVKGFALDDDRLKQGGAKNTYFDELLARIRDIRASERNFYVKVLEIYSTSLDYDPKADVSHDFFAIAQNKLHWATHGHTAAELIVGRADATKPNMGLTSWAGQCIRKPDVAVAKNYLTKDELEILNLIVSQYLDFAELQARMKKPMHMCDWVRKLDDFLHVNDREILRDAGRVSHQLAKEQAEAEFEKYHHRQLAEPSQKPSRMLDEVVKRIKSLPDRGDGEAT